MKKLFMVGIGGGIDGANIEVHDVQFIVAESIKDTYETLKRDWYGNSLHIDEYMILENIDGYKIALMDNPQNSEDRLFLVNMGGSVEHQFGETHEFGLFVSKTEENAEISGRTKLLKHTYDTHIDYVQDVQSRLKFADGKKTFIHLVPETNVSEANKYYNVFIKIKP